ncbi:MAG: hypothetical protein ACR2OZ_15950 [Verrucomicrobiales bacterium]
MKLASFHGTYEAPAEAIVIDAVQDDPRLDSEWPRPVPPEEVPALNFDIAFWQGAGVGIRHYTLQGPVGGGELLPNAMAVIPDSEKRYYYGGDSDPFRFDTESGQVEELPVPAPLPEVSWPRGAAFDTQRNQAVLVTLGGEGFLYSFSSETKAWSVISDMNNVDADSIAYHAPDDSLYFVPNSYSTIHLPAVQRLSAADGSELGRIRLPQLSFEIASHHGARSEIISVGEYLVVLLDVRQSHYNPRPESRIYLVDPRTGEVKLTYRQIGEPPPAPPPPSVPAFPSATNITISEMPPPPNVDAARPWWSAKVELTFAHPNAEVTKWGELAREGSTFSVDVEAVQPDGPPPLSPHNVTHAHYYPLGALAPGTYRFIVTSRGRTLGEKEFTIPQEPDEIKANVTLTVDANDPNHVTAKAHIEFQGYYVVTEQLPVRRDDLGRFVLEAKVEPAGVISVFPPPPFPVRDLIYNLGALPVGHHRAVFKMNGRPYADAAFIVGDRPLVNAQVTAEIPTNVRGGIAAYVRIELPNDLHIMIDRGQVVRNENVFTVDATFARNPNPSPLAVTKVINREYFLGLLPAGDYRFSYEINGDTKLDKPFSVPSPPPPPDDVTLAFIETRQGDVSTAAGVGLSVPFGKTITDWGEMKIEGDQFKVSVTVGDAPPSTEPVSIAPVADPPRHLERHLYSLGIVEPGEYVLAVCEGTRLLGQKPFTVGPKPPPPPPPQPVVAFIKHGVENGSSYVEVGLAFPRPGLEVKDWGTPARLENRFKVNIAIGEAAPPPVPTDPPPGGTPVFLVGQTDASEPPSTASAEEIRHFDEIGEWPGHLVHHRYALGALENGDYAFAVCFGGQPAARLVFRVGEPFGPTMTIHGEHITVKTDGPHTFNIAYLANAGWQTEPGAGPVTVKGPHGFEAQATLKQCAQSTDPVGRTWLCRYEIEGPGDDWDAGDNGDYSVCVDPAFVVDQLGRTLEHPCAFGWRVRIEVEPPPHLPVEVAVSMRDGKWFADVKFDNTGGWFSADWGEIHLRGPVFSALAQLHDLPEGSLAPIPAWFEHTYALGELSPGRYQFVFGSNEGHCATLAFEVPGVEPPTPLDQWKLNLFGTMAPDDGNDSDADGLSLVGEFYLGCDPHSPEPPEIKPSLIQGPDGEWRLALTFRRVNAGDDSVRCTVQTSADMIHWNDSTETVELVPGAPDIDGTQEVSACQKLSLRLNRRTFMRLKIAKVAQE